MWGETLLRNIRKSKRKRHCLVNELELGGATCYLLTQVDEVSTCHDPVMCFIDEEVMGLYLCSDFMLSFEEPETCMLCYLPTILIPNHPCCYVELSILPCHFRSCARPSSSPPTPPTPPNPPTPNTPTPYLVWTPALDSSYSYDTIAAPWVCVWHVFAPERRLCTNDVMNE